MTSSELYALLRSTFADAEARIRAESGYAKALGFTVYGGGVFGDDVNFTIRTGYGLNSEVEVKGRDFHDCVAEMSRRLQFAQRQANLKLGPPTLDSSSVSITASDVAS